MQCKRASARDAGARGQRNALVREDVSGKHTAGAERCRATDVPVHPGLAIPIDHVHHRSARRGQGAPDLKHEKRARITLCIELERACQLCRRGKGIHAWGQGQAAQVLSGQIAGEGQGREEAHCSERVRLRLLGDRVGLVNRAGQGRAAQARNGTARIYAQVAADRRRAGVGDCGAAEYCESLCRPENRRCRGSGKYKSRTRNKSTRDYGF